MMLLSQLHQASFLTSAPNINFLPKDTGCEIAFAGRSNAGKSSALNALTRQSNLARTSKTPGRTQQINLFAVTPEHRLVDLPGYGYAKVPKALKEKWQHALAEYLQKRKSLRGLVVLMDIRHPFRDTDQELIHWAVASQIPVLVVLTKADKLKSGARKQALMQAYEAIPAFQGEVQVIAFSALNKLGLEDFEQIILGWMQQASSESLETEDANLEEPDKN